MTASQINQVDIGFVIDTTASMGGLLNVAKRHLIDIVTNLSQEKQLDTQIAIVQYRDHPPQDRSFVTRIHPFSSDQQVTQRVIHGLEAQGGGDTPEAVYDGLFTAITQLSWRPHSLRMITLIGDAIPHGYQYPNKKVVNFDDLICHKACNLTLNKVTAAAEEQKIVIHAIAISDDRETLDAFGRLAVATGGVCDRSNAQNAMLAIRQAIQTQFDQLDLDRRAVQLLAHSELDIGELAEQLNINRQTAAQSVSRLAKRNLLPE
ncbi:VWA domain-containing protein [Leptolyngbya sp. AN03gr2]|uniref:VWA domain-containing protein n=1 Tax=unclassified Leptolyngbya TaxID=2650499 RepID=UPI003D3183AB